MGTVTVTTKPLSYALRSLYPGAFASYQGVVFRVIGPEQTALRGVSPDMTLTMSVMQKLEEASGKELLKKAIQKIRKQVYEESRRDIPNLEKITVIVPKKVELRFDESLDIVYCSNPNCGTLDRLSYHKTPPKDRMPICRRCKSAPVQQAPVWIPHRLSKAITSHVLLGDTATGIIKNMGTAQIFCYYSKPGDKCTHPQSVDGKCDSDFVSKLGSLKMEDPQRPIDSLRRYNPHCPKGYKIDPIKLERPYRTGSYWYKMDFPRESMSVPLQVSAVERYILENDPEIDEVNEVLADVKPVLFNPRIVDLEKSRFTRMRVLEITYGFRIGNKFTGVSSYYIDGQDNNVIGRLIDTQGFLLVLKPEFHCLIRKLGEEFPENQNAEYLEEIALHSIKHALLVLTPMYTGFEPEKFFGSYDITSEEGGRVYVYDADEGGNGGFAALMDDKDNLVKMFRNIQRRLECPTRECPNACKQCLFIKNCGNVNRKLSRKLLLALEIFWPD
ncbi:MAG: DUF1998 domain-containing protein [Nitrososphaerota archaeon]